MSEDRMTSEQFHEQLNALVIEVVTKALKGESTTDGGMDWQDAERFLKLSASFLRRTTELTVYRSARGRPIITNYLADDTGSLVMPNIETDVSTYVLETLEDEAQGGNPGQVADDYTAGLQKVIDDIAKWKAAHMTP